MHNSSPTLSICGILTCLTLTSTFNWRQIPSSNSSADMTMLNIPSVHTDRTLMYKFHYLSVHTRVCCACQREPDSWGSRGRRPQTDRSDPASRGKNQTADPESQTSRPASHQSGRSWSCCSEPRIDRTRRRRIYGWTTSTKSSLAGPKETKKNPTKAWNSVSTKVPKLSLIVLFVVGSYIVLVHCG